jgi:hypothetical protein
MQGVNPIIAFESYPTSSIALIKLVGNNYNEFSRNLEKRFPGQGRRIARTLASHNQDKLYKVFSVYKKRGNTKKARFVYSPINELKVIQQLADRYTREQYKPHPNSHGFESGKSTRTAAEQLKHTPNINEKEVTNIDVSGAFPAISGRVVRSLLRHKSKIQLNNWQINIIAKIMTNSDDRLATGAPSSPAVFNWRMTSFDTELEKALPKGWDFARYADDITIIHHRTQKAEAIKLVIKLLNQLGLKIERTKLKTFRGNLKKIVGLNLQFGEITIPREIRRTARALAFKMRIYGIKSKNQYTVEEAFEIITKLPYELRRTKQSIEAQLAGFLAYVIHASKPMKVEQQS